MRIPVCFSCDNKYIPHLGVTITSILKNKNEDDNLVFYVLDGGMSEKNKEKLLSLKSINDFEIKFIKVDNTRFSEIRVYGKDHITDASYYRLILPEICSREDKIIYLDCDLVVRTSLREMLEIDLTDYYIGAVPDVENITQTKRLNVKQYVNSGVLLVNVWAWQRDNIVAKIFDWAKKNREKILFHDQDILNYTLEEKIKIIDSVWNTQVSKVKNNNVILHEGQSQEATEPNFKKSFENAKIIHYVAYKPWKGPLQYINKKDLYFEYLALTPWKNLKYKFKLNNLKYEFKLFIKWLFSIYNINKETKIVQLFGKTVIKIKNAN
jgi:lipopolysaccharide biosynthesis glycosyltransferase